MQWFAQAPSNIALIKYMGKKDGLRNIPDNASLSYTLNHLLSTVELEKQPGQRDFWEPLKIPGASQFELSSSSQTRYLAHLARLKNHFGYSGGFIVRSNNNFPHSSGLASSASSFAALTKCAILALCELTQKTMPPIAIQAQLSREGSGSSCRSFFSPWALWQDETVQAIDLPFKDLIHQVILISHEEKKISSAKAHELVHTSPLYSTRQQRAETNLKELLRALKTQDWEAMHRICWRDFQDMHQLFRTSVRPFNYITPRTNQALQLLQNLWQREGDGPLITMDAGPNIHLLYRANQAQLAQKFKQDSLLGNYDFI